MLYQLQVYRRLKQDWIKMVTINLSSSVTKKSFVSSFMIWTKRKFHPTSRIPKMMMMRTDPGLVVFCDVRVYFCSAKPAWAAGSPSSEATQSWSWVGSIHGLGWVGWRLDCVTFLTSWNTLLSVNEYCSWIITFIDSWLVECRVNKLNIG